MAGVEELKDSLESLPPACLSFSYYHFLLSFSILFFLLELSLRRIFHCLPRAFLFFSGFSLPRLYPSLPFLCLSPLFLVCLSFSLFLCLCLSFT